MSSELRLENVDDRLVERLRERALRHGRSIEAEHRHILREALEAEDVTFDELSAQLRVLTSDRRHTPAEVLLRESRSER